MLHRVLVALLLGVALGLGYRVVEYSLKGAAFYAAYASRRAPGEQLDTGAAFFIEGLTFGVLPAGSDKEAVTSATFNAAAAYDQAATTYAWAIGGVLVLAAACAAVQRFTAKSNAVRSPLVGVLLASSLVCLGVGVLSPIMSVIGYGEVPLVGTSIVKYSSKSILSAAEQLVQSGKAWVGYMILVFSIATPLAKLGLSLVAAQTGSERARRFALKVVNVIGKWSMADVFVVALLLAAFSLRGNGGEDTSTNAEVGLGLYFFASYCILSLVTGQILQRNASRVVGDVLGGQGSAQALVRSVSLMGVMATAAVLSGWFLRANTRVDQSFVVQVGTMHTCAVFAENGPGVVSGRWESRGAQHGGSDDTIVSASLLGPSGDTIRYWDHASSGTLAESVAAAGVYSLVFSNVGIVRSTDRSVRVELGYTAK